MMMPANFSAVSENEMTYVMGGASLADYLAPVMETAQWQKFSTNMVTLVGNLYLDKFLTNTIGAMFNGTWKPGNGLKAFGSDLGAVWGNNFVDGTNKEKVLTGMKGVLNVGLYLLGNAAAIYTLGFGTVKNKAEDASITVVKF